MSTGAEPNQDDVFALAEELPETLPAEPMLWIQKWIQHATTEKVQRNPNAVTLATIEPDGKPSVRVVLAKGLSVEEGWIVFYTNYHSRKARALEANPHAALCFHWDEYELQARISGPVTRAPDADSDAYFASRHPASRIGAWASEQSAPLASRDDLLASVMDTMRRFGADFDTMCDGGDIEIPRPPFWGGYRVWAEEIELWVGNPIRVHDRAVWTRTLTPEAGAFSGGPWSATRLQP